MKPCQCGSLNIRVTLSDTQVCLACGRENRISFEINHHIIGYNQLPSERLVQQYTRVKRFQNMMYSILSPVSYKSDELMINYLSKFGRFVDVKSILSAIKKSGLKDKRYISLHLFAKLFLRGYKRPVYPNNILQVKQSILRMFTEIELKHRQLFTNPFFNYLWLLGELFKKHKLCKFIKYIKPLSCEKREGCYESDLEKIMIELCRSDRYVGDQVCVSNFQPQPAG